MNTKTTQKTFSGEVVSTKMDKTIVVRVSRNVVHPKYGKRYLTSKKYHVHDEQNTHHVGDIVEFQECRPLSKNKRWRVINKKNTK